MGDRILIFTNTLWEADALVAVFVNERAHPPTRPTSTEGKPPPAGYFFPPAIVCPTVSIPGTEGTPARLVRARLAYEGVEVWCISDLLGTLPPSAKNKAALIPLVAKNGIKPTLVTAFGTAAFADPSSYDGCVVIGARVFNFSPKIANRNGDAAWEDPSIGKLSGNPNQAINSIAFGNLRTQLRLQIESRFLIPPVDAAKQPILMASASYVAVSDLNIDNVDDYAWADKEAVVALMKEDSHALVGSVETTHGIIYATTKADQFLFVSAIANRLGYFNMEAAPRNYAQDFAVAHNAAVALAWLLPTLLTH